MGELSHKLICAESIALAAIMTVMSAPQPSVLFVLIVSSVGELYVLILLLLADKLASFDY